MLSLTGHAASSRLLVPIKGKAQPIDLALHYAQSPKQIEVLQLMSTAIVPGTPGSVQVLLKTPAPTKRLPKPILF